MPRRPNERWRIRGPYKHRARWRVIVVAPGGKTDTHSFATEAEALAVIRDYRLDHGDGRSVEVCLEKWKGELETEGLAEVTVETLMRRTRKFLAPSLSDEVKSLTPKRCTELYKKLRGTCAVQTHHLALSETKRFLRWCVDQGLLSSNPAAKLKRVGRPNKGKPQLRVTESRKLVDVAVAESCQGDESAVAVLIALVLGRRASEVTNLAVRDVDDGASLLWVADAKTPAGRIYVEVPVVLRPILLALAEARSATKETRLFPGRSRYWVYYHSLRLCRLAGVPPVCPHGLRGTHSTLADQAGATAEMVVKAMGWTNIAVGERHYFAPGARSRSKASRAAARLLGAAGTETNS